MTVVTGPGALEQLGWVVRIQNVVTGAQVSFPAYIADYMDQFMSTWNKEDIYGRMDPLAVFQSVQRRVSISLDVPSSSLEEARENLA